MLQNFIEDFWDQGNLKKNFRQKTYHQGNMYTTLRKVKCDIVVKFLTTNSKLQTTDNHFLKIHTNYDYYLMRVNIWIHLYQVSIVILIILAAS